MTAADGAAAPNLVVVGSDRLPAAAAAHVAQLGRRCLAERGRFVLALSGGTTPEPMCAALFRMDLDWSRAAILQVDERIAPAGHPDRNLGMIRRTLTGTAATAAELVPMPVDGLLAADDDGGRAADPAAVRAATRQYAQDLERVTGGDAVIDVAQLGIGEDGHTASLVPGDPVLEVADADVAVTAQPYEGRHRMTLTYPCLNRTRSLLWLVAQPGKRAAVEGLLRGDPALPASGIRRDAVVFADHDAAVAEGDGTAQ